MAITYLDEAPAETGSRIEYLDEPNPWPSRVSKYVVHPVIESGTMGLAGLAGATMAAPAGPLASAAAGPALAIASYPSAHEAANVIDRIMGLNPTEMALPESLKEGAMMEAAGRALPAAAKAVSKIPFAKFAEGLTGSPAQNFRRMFQKGLPAYGASSLEEAGAKFGAEKFKLLGQALTPEEQARMVTNPNGAATEKLTDVMTAWLKGEEISAKDALMARQAADTVFPADTAKQAVRRGTLSQFRNEMNDILDKTAPEMKQASDQYAAAKLKSQMLQPIRVNKSNPDQPSKLGIMFDLSTAVFAGHGDFGKAIAAFAAQSPAFSGFVSALSGSLSKLLPKLGPEQQRALARGLYSSFQTQEAQNQ